MSPPPLPVRVRLRYPDLDTFVEKFAPNVTRGGIFLASRDPKPVGSLLRFEVCLMDGTPALTGEGKVTWVKPFNPAEPSRPHGMGVQFTTLDAGSRPVLDRLVQKREAAGPPRKTTGANPVVSAAPAAIPARATNVREVERLDTNEFDRVEESALRRMVDRARVLSARTDDIEELLKTENEEPASLTQALQELPRYLSARRNTGVHRVPPEATAPAPNEEKKKD